jgi:hypothetical protein
MFGCYTIIFRLLRLTIILKAVFSVDVFRDIHNEVETG